MPERKSESGGARMKRMAVLFLAGSMAAMAAAAEEPKKDVAALESGAVGVMRTINTAEVTYAATYSAKGFACSLEPMMVGPEGSKPSAEHAGLIDQSVKDGKDRMYRFDVRCPGGTQKPAKAYEATATPLVKGARAICSDESGKIRWAERNAKRCVERGEPIE